MFRSQPSSIESSANFDMSTKKGCSIHYSLFPNRGVAIIFNHLTFSTNDPNEHRFGTEKDSQDMQEVLKELGFDVRVFNDCTYKQIIDVLDAVSQENHSKCACLFVVVMSHGEQGGYLRAHDMAYKVEELWEKFVGNKCKGLIGKPKMFFIQVSISTIHKHRNDVNSKKCEYFDEIVRPLFHPNKRFLRSSMNLSSVSDKHSLQACRGEKTERGVEIPPGNITDAQAARYKLLNTIPTMADLLVMYSTFEGYFSIRDENNGSWFIQSLVAELRENALEKDFFQVLIGVTKRVAFNYEHTPQGENEPIRQIPCFISTLTRELKFNKMK